LFFAVAAILHAAPLPAVPLTRVDEVDIAVGSATLSDSSSLNFDQQALDGKGTRVQGGLGSGRARPSVTRKTRRWVVRHENPGFASRLHSRRNRIQVALRRALPFVRRRQYAVDMLPQLASAFGDALACGPRERLQPCGQRRLNESRQFAEAHKIAISSQVLDRPIEGALVQRVDEVQGRVTSAPLEWVGTTAHSRSCLLPAVAIL
jgi:hypothetical protein